MIKVNLLRFRGDGSKIFSGREQGVRERNELRLNVLDDGEEEINIIIPKDTWSINSSFFGGLFESSIIKLTEQGFRKKYKFKMDDGSDLSSDLQQNVDEGIFEALNDI